MTRWREWPGTSTTAGLAAVVGLAAMSALAGCASSSSGTSSGPAGPSGGSNAGATGLQDAYESVISNTLPSIVQINTATGLGSGIILDTKGDIVTNAHVVGAAKTFTVSLSTGGDTLAASLIAA